LYNQTILCGGGAILIRQFCSNVLTKYVFPHYDEISRAVVPRVEFVRGIPMDLDGDHYFDPRIRNVIVLDDLMSTAAYVFPHPVGPVMFAVNG
jgi:hypothetical protein